VINFDLPRKAEDYIHRIGRTGRADRQGKAYSLVTINDRPMISKIERYAKVSIDLLTIEGEPQEKDFRSEPAKKIFKKKFKSKKKLSSKRNSNKTQTFSHRS
jgi:ATP-dependent RNA helicase RhlE